MSDLSKLTLKGHFEQLKNQMNEMAGSKKSDIKATGMSSTAHANNYKLLELIIKSVALVEEIHQTDADFLHSDHVSDYRSMLEALQHHGIAYKGQSEILEIAPSSPSPILDQKKPMQKAGLSKRAISARRRRAS